MNHLVRRLRAAVTRRKSASVVVSVVAAAVLGAAGAVGVSVATAAPAMAASCPSNTFGPYTWANKYATSARGTEMRLDVAYPYHDNGDTIHLWHTYNGAAAQYWCLQFQYRNNGYGVYKFINAYTGKCMDINGPSSANGTDVHQWDCNGYADYRSQQWEQIPANGGYMFRNIYSWSCLDARGWGTTDGTQLQIWTCGDTSKANQIFF
jgi:glucosylceramidase